MRGSIVEGSGSGGGSPSYYQIALGCPPDGGKLGLGWGDVAELPIEDFTDRFQV
jgi:hypothetical protein